MINALRKIIYHEHHTEHKRRRHTPVDAVESAVDGSLTTISKIPSATFLNVADHDHAEAATPGICDSTGFVTVLHDTVDGSSVGGPPMPEDDKLNVTLFVTPVHDIATLNSRTTFTFVAFGSPCMTSMRASCPGKNLVSIGSGATHSVVGTNALIP